MRCYEEEDDDEQGKRILVRNRLHHFSLFKIQGISQSIYASTSQRWIELLQFFFYFFVLLFEDASALLIGLKMIAINRRDDIHLSNSKKSVIAKEIWAWVGSCIKSWETSDCLTLTTRHLFSCVWNESDLRKPTTTQYEELYKRHEWAEEIRTARVSKQRLSPRISLPRLSLLLSVTFSLYVTSSQFILPMTCLSFSVWKLQWN